MSYDAFAAGGIHAPDRFNGHAAPAALPGTGTGTGYPYAAASASASVSASSASAASAAAALLDESAVQWVQRDAAHPKAPDVLKHMSGSVKLSQLIPGLLEETERAGGSADPAYARQGYDSGASTHTHVAGRDRAGSHSRLDPRMHAGDVLEVYGRSGSGKTEVLYQALLTALLPKMLSSSPLGPLSLGGLDGGAIVLDLDYRFNITRLEQLMQARIRRVCALLLPAFAHSLGSEDSAREHIDSQTPRQLLGALRQADALCEGYKRHSWGYLHRDKAESGERKEDTNGASHMMDVDVNDPSFNPTVSGATAAAASSTPRSTSSSSAAAAPRIVLCCVDNVAAMHWLVKGQPPGYAGMALGSHAPERVSVTTGSDQGAGQQGAGGGDRNKSWLYELFSQQLRAMLHSRALIGIATKPAMSRRQAEDLQQHFAHEEFLDLNWNRLVTLRLSLREQPDLAAHARTHGGAVSSAPRGVLRRAMLKDVLAASKGPAHGSTPAMMEFSFRIGAEGIKSHEQ